MASLSSKLANVSFSGVECWAVVCNLYDSFKLAVNSSILTLGLCWLMRGQVTQAERSSKSHQHNTTRSQLTQQQQTHKGAQATRRRAAAFLCSPLPRTASSAHQRSHQSHNLHINSTQHQGTNTRRQRQQEIEHFTNVACCFSASIDVCCLVHLSCCPRDVCTRLHPSSRQESSLPGLCLLHLCTLSLHCRRREISPVVHLPRQSCSEQSVDSVRRSAAVGRRSAE